MDLRPILQSSPSAHQIPPHLLLGALPGSPSSDLYQSKEQPVGFSYPHPPCTSSHSQAAAALPSSGILLEMQSLRPTLEYAEGSLCLERFPVNWTCIKVGGALDHKAILAKRLLLSLCGNLSLGSCSSLIRQGALQSLESRAGFFASTRDECLSPRVRLECNPEIPVAPGEEHWLLDTSLDDEPRDTCPLICLILSS